MQMHMPTYKQMGTRTHAPNKQNQTTSNGIKVKISVLHGLCDVTDYFLLGLAWL